VGYKLYREIIENAPYDWTTGERLVALAIADDARDTTRRSWIPLYELCARTGYTPRGVRNVLSRLGRRGFEFRVSHGLGKDGRDVYAARSHAVDYLVPAMPKGGTRMPPLAIPIPVDNPPKGGTTRTPTPDKGGTEAPPWAAKGGTLGSKGGTLVPPLPSIPSHPGVSVVSGAVEVGRDPPGQEQRPRVDVAAGMLAAPTARMSSIETAAWQAARARRQVGEARREREERERQERAGQPSEPETPEEGERLCSASCSTR
jgi:hypothetical protein